MTHLSSDPPAPAEACVGAGEAPARTAKAKLAKAKPARVILVCRKCAKRQGLTGKAARRIAKRAAEGTGGAGKRAVKARVVETGCLGPCPKRLLAVATGASLAAGRVVLLDPRAAAPAPIPDFGPNAALAAGAPAAGPATEP